MSEREAAYARITFILQGAKDEPDFFAPFYPPIEGDAFATFPALYRELVPWEWTGDVEAIRSITKKTGEALLDDRAHPERVFVDAGIVSQLKRCGYSSVYWTTCKVPRDEKLHGFERQIQANRAKMWSAVGGLLDGVAAVASFIPVIGQAVAVVLSAAAAVATKRPITGALADMIVSAVPGGPAVKNAVAPAVALGKSLASGDAAEQALIRAARALAVEVGGENAGTAFDLALAVARGDDLQEAGFGVLYRWFPGTSVADRAGRFGTRMLRAAARGESVERLLIREARSELMAIPFAQSAVDRAVKELVGDPRQYVGSIEAFRARFGFPIEVARAAFMSVKDNGDGTLSESTAVRTVLVDPRAPIEGESAMIARAREWAEPKRDLQRAEIVKRAEIQNRDAVARKEPVHTSTIAQGPAQTIKSAVRRALGMTSAPAASTSTERERAPAPAPRSEVPPVVLAAGAVAAGVVLLTVLTGKRSSS